MRADNRIRHDVYLTLRLVESLSVPGLHTLLPLVEQGGRDVGECEEYEEEVEDDKEVHRRSVVEARLKMHTLHLLQRHDRLIHV